MKNTCAIILAAGEGTRIKSNKPKVLSTVLFRPMIQWVINAIKASGINDICVVSGFKHELLDLYLNQIDPSINVVTQEKRLGTAHAVMMAEGFLEDHLEYDVLIVGGDSPFVDCDTIKESYALHKVKDNAATIVSAKVKEPFGYGRIVRENNKVRAVIEQKDASFEIQKIDEVNSGAYWFNIPILLGTLPQIGSNNAQNEMYLTDAIQILIEKGLDVDAYMTGSEDIVYGANDCLQLGTLNEIARHKTLNQLMRDGVDIPCRDGVIIDPQVKLGKYIRVLPGSVIKGSSSIGDNCIVGPNTFINNSKVGENVTLNSVYCNCTSIADNESVEPFSVIDGNDL